MWGTSGRKQAACKKYGKAQEVVMGDLDWLGVKERKKNEWRCVAEEVDPGPEQ